MRRKSNAPKLKEKTNIVESTIVTVSEVQMEPNNGNPTLQPESLKQTANSTLEGVKLNLQMQANIADSHSKEIARQITGRLRRSARLQTSAVVTQNQDKKHVIEEIITLAECEEEDAPVDEKLPEPTSMGKNLEGKLEAQQKTTNATSNSFRGSCSDGGDITYKSLYFDSQKKVENLMGENYQLNLKLQNALGKIEAMHMRSIPGSGPVLFSLQYENGNLMVCDVMEKFNEILLSRLHNTSEPETVAGLEQRTSRKKKRNET